MSEAMKKWLEDAGNVNYEKGSGLSLGAFAGGEENHCAIFMIDKKTDKALGGTPLVVFPADEKNAFGYVIFAYELAYEIAEYYGEYNLAETMKATGFIERAIHNLL